MNELGMPMIVRPAQGYEEYRRHRDHLRHQPALQRFTDPIHDHSCACAMPRRSHE
jgi:hypothetical protein